MFIFSIFVKYQAAIAMHTQGLAFCFVPLFYMSVFVLVPQCFYSYNCVIYQKKASIEIPPELFFLLRIFLAIQGLFCFHMHYRTALSSIFVKSAMGIFILIAMIL